MKVDQNAVVDGLLQMFLETENANLPVYLFPNTDMIT